MMKRGELEITDGTTTINLRTGALRLVEWTPVTAQPKGGGVWNDSVLDDNRRPVMFKRANAVETFELRVVTDNMDDTIYYTQELRRLLEKAKEYWTTAWQNQPVWLVARGNCETNTRYAYIVNYTAERDDNPYQSPFDSTLKSTIDEFTLNIERMDWMSNPPGEGDCVQIDNQQVYWDDTDEGTFRPTQSGDDCEIDMNAGTIALAGAGIYLGLNAGSRYASGIRFRNVTVPVGAVITYARIDIVASNPDAGNELHLEIRGDLDTTPAIFTTYADFVGRTLTTAVKWRGITAGWNAGITYVLMNDTTDSRAIIQEIIDTAGWAPGNDLAIIIYDNGSSSGTRRYSSWDNIAFTEPILYLEWVESTEGAGRSATCLNEVYIANKHVDAQITTVWSYDAAPVTWTDIMAGPLPIDLFPAVPAANDILYIGINTALANSGPFSNVIFDIGTAANDILNIRWEYWNGAWAALTTYSTIDNIPGYFNVTGVGNIYFSPPADWVTTAVNGITGYWIRCLILGVGAAPTAPTQQNRNLYTALRPSVDIDEAQIEGDITALGRVLVETEDRTSGVILATRSEERGSNFRMYLNFADEQNPPGVTVDPVSNTSIVNQTLSPTGRAVLYNPGAGSTGEVTILLPDTIAQEYIGKYRVYLRMYKNSAVLDASVRLRVGVETAGAILRAFYFETDYIVPISNIDGYIVDFGVVDIPGYGVLKDGDTLSTILLDIYLSNTSANPNIYLYDLILVPVDEWAGEFQVPGINSDVETIQGIALAGEETATYLDVDSLNLKRRTVSALRMLDDDRYVLNWKDYTASSMKLQANKDQQLYAAFMTYDFVSGVWFMWKHNIGKLQLTANARYLSFRGDR